MSRTIDKVLVLVTIAIVGFVLGAYITNNWLWSGLLGLLSSGLAICLAKAIPARKRMSLAKFGQCLLLEGKTLSNRYLFALYPPKEPQSMDVEWYKDDKDSVVFNLYGFGKLGEETAAKIYRTAKQQNATMCAVLTNGIDRKALSILSYMHCPIVFVKVRQLYAQASKEGMPDLPRPKRHIEVKEILRSIPTPRAALYLLLASLSSLLLSFLLPIKNYYRISSLVLAILSALVMIWWLKAKN